MRILNLKCGTVDMFEFELLAHGNKTNSFIIRSDYYRIWRVHPENE